MPRIAAARSSLVQFAPGGLISVERDAATVATLRTSAEAAGLSLPLPC
ncbi:hypothetical protein [Opitutus sp. ER46]|nr:hypothetical protein [Opitutus sp. ER46]